ncbi:MAG: hypothetical protein ACTSRP_11465 [Candidatus Helarchaeota archaeon]
MANKRRTIRLPESYIRIMDELINRQIMPCYGEIVRAALDKLIRKDLEFLKVYDKKINGNNLKYLKKIKLKQTKIDDFFGSF